MMVQEDFQLEVCKYSAVNSQLGKKTEILMDSTFEEKYFVLDLRIKFVAMNTD